jgi:hypothetical protein
VTEPTLRAARFAYSEEGAELLRRLGLAMPSRRGRLDAHWRRLWRDNPALAGSSA